ncbi:hypothetical protein ABZ388_06930 [Micromonospora parva]|uniref:hypothetical protein n=1 Tax=Micromonospora parva TaxID=1464048 RepID=UPI00340FA43F
MAGKTFGIRAMDDETDLACVRYDGDPDVATALYWAFAIREDIDYSIQPPEPGLYRWNPDPSQEFAGLLTPVDKPGRGVFLGAPVKRGTYFEPAWMREFSQRQAVS